MAVGTASALAMFTKWLYGVVSFLFIFLFGWIFRKLNSTMTKAETEHLIDLKLEPLVTVIEKNAEIQSEQTKSIDKLADAIETMNSSFIEVRTETRLQRELLQRR